MNRNPSPPVDVLERIHRFVVASESNQLAEDQMADFEQFLRADDDACRLYVEYMNVSTLTSYALDTMPKEDASWDASSAQKPPIPAISIPGFHAAAPLGVAGYFSDGWPMAYLIATVVMVTALMIGAITHVSKPGQVVEHSVPSPLSTVPSVVGRITGMVDCQLAVVREDKLPSPACGRGAGGEGGLNKTIALHSTIRLGDHLNISSGLLEITYDTGAQVILQGPVKYEVESTNGGFMSVGKLTGKVTSAAARGLTIRTPTAVVTDLGTEFGVEVSKEGHTTSHVFRGSIEVRIASPNGNTSANAKILRENESVCVEENGANRRIVIVPNLAPSNFVRNISKRTAQILDLVDVVAGGNGFSGRRNGGIDPTTGRATNTPPTPMETWFKGDQKYHRVETLPLVDGVFIPDGRTGKVQVDSAGHTFADFPKTNNATACYIWAGGIIPQEHVYPSFTVLNGIDYARPGHGVLFLHANKGITFDLGAIRKANPNWKPNRFCALAGNTEKGSEKGAPVSVDLWVLVDGQVRYRRREINGYNGAFSIAFPIDEQDHFLTLAATANGDGIGYDWIMFGDPRLELLPMASEHSSRTGVEE